MTSPVSPDIEVAVIGAGVIGLAIAKTLAMAGREVIVLERNGAVGQETSSRNSEVIHAGLYHPPGSLKAELCVSGREKLYRFAEANAIPHRRTGKLIVATSAEEERCLADIAKRAASNSVDDLRPLTALQANAVEPNLHCTAALFSPSTGIIDGHAYMQALEGHLTSHRGSVVFNTEVRSVSVDPAGNFRLTCRDLNSPTAGPDDASDFREHSHLTSRILIVAAGHGMSDLRAKLPRTGTDDSPPTFLAKGHYYTLRSKPPFTHLIYPVPVAGGLGIHLTLDLAGRARFGPDVEWVDTIDYRFEEDGGRRRSGFATAIQKYWPDLVETDLEPAYTGIRPKVSGPGTPAADFVIDGPAQHGVPGMVTLDGIESPGLTASLAIAEHVVHLLRN